MLSSGIHIGRRGVRLTGGGEETPLWLAGVQLWLDAESNLYQQDDGTVVATANDAPVAYWGDLSGNNRHVTVSNLAHRPLLKTNILNSRPVVRFDASDDRLTHTLSAAIPLSAMWCMAVANATQGQNDRVLLDIGNGTQDSIYFAKSISSFPGRWSFNDFNGTTVGGLYNDVTTANTWMTNAILMGVYDGTSWYQYVNGVQVATITNSKNTTGYTGLSVGNLVGGGRPLNGDIAMLSLCNVAPSIATLNAAGAYAAARWGLSWTNIV